MTTRRQFLLSCSTAAVAVAAGPTATLAASATPTEVSLDRITFAAFARQVNTVFKVDDGAGGAIELELFRAEAAPALSANAASARDARHEKFSLLFRGPLRPRCPESACLFEHRALGRFRMFVSPVGARDKAHRYYEAVFNRLPPGRSAVGTSGQPARP